MKNAFYTFTLFLLVSTTYGKERLNGPIDTALIKNASVLKNDENIMLEVSDVDRYTYTVHQVFTILNERGKEQLEFAEYTNKYISLEEAEIKVYNALGIQTNKFKKKDMTTVAYGNGLVEDGYVTYFRIPAPFYPITVEYDYQVKSKGTVIYPSFDIMSSGEAVLRSTFTARVLKELDLRYKEKNIQLKPVITEDSKYKQYQWTVQNMKALEYEEGTAQRESRYPCIQLAPNKFSYYDHEGDLTSWKKFGAWLGDLYTGLDELPQDRKDFFKALVKGASTDKEKAQIIYKYLQNNFRYISIQLGIGGMKPFPAAFTDVKKYGDCKGLSNYMKAALKAVGVKSYVAIINAEYNSEPVDAAFPHNDFNHVILCIPQPKDSIWLECTSNNADFGVLGSFTENRNALLITEDGGMFVPTPKSKSQENIINAKTLVELAEDGSGSSTTVLSSSGDYKSDIEENLLDEKKDDQKEFLIFRYGFKQPDGFEIAKVNDSSMLSASIKMVIDKVPEFTAGSKMFIAPRLYKLWSHKLPKAENRRLDFYFHNPFIKSDTTIYKMPEGYEVEALPSGKSFACDFGTYTNKCWFDADKNSVYSTALFELTQLKIPAAKYAAVKTFFDEVMQEDAQMIVIKKK